MPSNQNKQQELDHAAKIVHNPEFYWNSATEAGKRGSLRRAKWIMEQVQMTKGQRILEIGCGTGFFTEVFAETGAELHGIDLAEILLEKARERAGARASFHLADVEKLLFDDGYFDAIVGVRILHHLDLPNAFREINRVLKKEGVIAFCEPNMMNPQMMIQKNIPWIKKAMGDTPDETAFFKWKLKKFLNDQGYAELFIEPFDFLHPWVPNSMVNVIEKIGSQIENIPLLREIGGSLQIFGRKV